MRYFLGLFLFSVLMAASADDRCRDFAAAKQQAAKEEKVVYVLITTPDCRWCRRFEQTTLADAKVKARLEALAVGVEVTRGDGGYPDTLSAPMVPMHYFLAPDETVLVKMPGYWNVVDFMSILDDVERKRK